MVREALEGGLVWPVRLLLLQHPAVRPSARRDAAFAPDGPALEERLLELTAGRGTDIAYECSGQGSVLSSVVPLMRPDGKLMLTGAPMAPV